MLGRIKNLERKSFNMSGIDDKELEKIYNEGIESNYNFEKKLAEDINYEEINSFLEFIFGKKKEFIDIERIVKKENVKYIGIGNLGYFKGSSVNENIKAKTLYRDDEVEKVEGDYEKDDNYIDYVEWVIAYRKEDSYYNKFKITISPFFYDMEVHNDDGNSEYYDTVSICSRTVYDEWDSKLESIFIEMKQEKIPKMLDNIYDLLGVMRSFKIKKLLDDK